MLFRREDLLSFIVSISPGQTVVASPPPPPVDQLLRTHGGDVSRVAGAVPPPHLPSLQDMLDLSRLETGGERYKRPAPSSSPSNDESMDSPSCKRSRMN